MRILVVEDESKIAAFIQQGLEEQGFKVEVCGDGDTASEWLLHRTYDAVVLDILLPGKDGLSLLRELRDRKSALPVVLLTARSEPNERVEGLNLGADDYLTKPFYIEELIARLHAVTRRTREGVLGVLRVDSLLVNLLNRTITRGTRKIELTAREFALLEKLMSNPGRIFSRTQLLEQVWGYDFDPETNLVDVNIGRLRRKIDAPDEPPLIETVRGVGYRIREKA